MDPQWSMTMTESNFSSRQNWIWTCGPSNVRRWLFYHCDTQLFVLKILHLYGVQISIRMPLVYRDIVHSACYKKDWFEGYNILISLLPKRSIVCNMPYLVEHLSNIQKYRLFTIWIRHFPTPTSNQMWFSKTIAIHRHSQV